MQLYTDAVKCLFMDRQIDFVIDFKLYVQYAIKFIIVSLIRYKYFTVHSVRFISHFMVTHLPNHLFTNLMSNKNLTEILVL